MNSMDPFASPNANATNAVPDLGSASIYPEGFYRPVTRFDTMRMIQSPFKSPNWVMNLVWMFLCQLAGIVMVGGIVAFGYMAEVAEARSGGRSDDWPDFKAEKLTDYLLRGLWPFLWNLIWNMALYFIVGVPALITVFLFRMLMGGGQDVPGMIVAIVGGGVSVALAVFGMVIMTASMIHSALGNDFMKGADIAWLSSYVSKMTVTSIAVGLIYTFVSFVFGAIGILLFCVGLLVVVPLMYLMAADATAQLHDIFVSRGGRPAFGGNAADEIIDASVVV